MTEKDLELFKMDQGKKSNLLVFLAVLSICAIR